MAGNQTSLAVKYRPRLFEDMCGQETVIQILKHQIETNTFKQAYLFSGAFGCGKTTSARIFARTINGGREDIIEIDAASYNGVEQVRLIIDEARKKPLIGKFKIFVIDECHMISTAGNNALLKLLEEPPATAMFILCTTDPQKMLNTVLSRVQRYDFTKIPTEQIIQRLTYIANEEKIESDAAAIRYIAKLADGGMRDSISMLEKCHALNSKITVEVVAKTLAVVGYDEHLELLSALVAKNSAAAVKIISDVYDSGKDLKKFMAQFMWCVCDVCNYFVFNSFDYINIPELPEYKAKMAEFDMKSCLPILEWSKKLNGQIRGDNTPRNAILVEVMLWTLGQ